MKSRIFKSIVATLLGVVLTSGLRAQVPGIISYQGRVQVGGTNFTGTGQFKFALVDGGSNAVRQATATAIVSGGFLIDYTVTDGGAGYFTPPTVTITDTTGSGATATAQISGGSVTNLQPNNAGSGYSPSPTVTIDPPPPNLVFATFWSNDGTSPDGAEPAAPVSVSVQDGLFTVLLGDANRANMTGIPAAVFSNPDVHLRIWFDDGVHGFAQLTPDQPIGAVGYAMVADTADHATTAMQAQSATSAAQAPWSGITGIPAGLADGIDNDTTYSAGTGLNLVGTTFSIATLGVGTSQLANSSVTSTKLADNAVTSAKLANDADSLGKLSGNTIRKVGSDLGVSTAAPTARLDVAGTVRLRGGSLGTGLTVNSSGDVGIGATNSNLRAKLRVVNSSSGYEPTTTHTVLLESAGTVSLALRTSLTNSVVGQDIYFERPVGERGARIHLDSDGVLNIGRHTFTLGGGSVSSHDLNLDLTNGNLGIQRIPSANDLEVAGNASKSTAGDWLANSDRRIKTDVQDLAKGRDTLMKLRPVKFRYSNEWLERNPDIQDREYLNFIAQEYREVFPHAVKGSGEYLEGDPEEILQLDTHDAQMVTIKAVQELILENRSLRAEMNELKRHFTQVTERLNGGVQ